MDNDKERWKNSSRAVRLRQRQDIISAIREYLYSQGFLEVETPILVKSTCPDTWIDTVQVGHHYLVTSTEYQIKRMMVGGFEKVFTLGKNFRDNDRGRNHSTEFTMLEWARSNESLKAIEEDTVHFIRHAFRKLYQEKATVLSTVMRSITSQVIGKGSQFESLRNSLGDKGFRRFFIRISFKGCPHCRHHDPRRF